MKVNKARQEECKKALLDILQPGATVYTKLDHVSRSGMYRVISMYVIKENEPIWITRYAADLLEGYDKRHEGAKASGCGMDMGFHLVNSLGYILFPDGFGCIGDKCPSNDHSNGDRNYKPHGLVEHWHKSGGYALKHKWL